MELSQFLTAVVGAFFGAAGWLLVGLYIQRKAADRAARSAARAVYFELAMNEIDIDVAAKHGVFNSTARTGILGQGGCPLVDAGGQERLSGING